MRLLLLNNNPAVSRLIKLSVDKVGYAMDEFDDYDLVPLTNYDVIMVDNELYDEAELKALSEQVHCEYFLYICQRGSEKPAFVNVSLEKPFLPTDFLTLLEKIKNVVNSFKGDESKEEPLPFEENNDDTMQVFDIDDIDTFGIEENNELDLLEEKEDDMEEENETKLAFDDIENEEIKDDGLPLTLDLEDEEDDDLEKSVSDSLADFDFEENEETIEEEKDEDKETQEADTFEEISSSILDKDDINEVKQLLNENNDEDEKEEDFDFSLGDTSPELMEDDDKEFSFDKDFVADTQEDDIEEEALSFDDVTLDNPQEDEVSSTEEELPLETQEEIIDDFAEEIEEKIEEEAEQEVILPTVAFEMEDIDSLDVESLDDLSENLLKKAFGEEVDEEIKPQESVPEIEVMRGEIESSIARSISSFAQSDILREALKGMKINISITFDEKN